MSTFADSLKDRVSEDFQQVGKIYHTSGQVDLTEVAHGSLEATVLGADGAKVTLQWVPKSDTAILCSCPLFEGEGMCWHVWAVVLMADEQHLDGDGFGRAIASKEQEAKSPWKDRIESVMRASRGERGYDPWRDLEADASELRFVLDLGATDAREQPCLRTFLRKRGKDGEWEESRQVSVPRLIMEGRVSAEDRRLLSLLGYGTREAVVAQTGHGMGTYEPSTLTLGDELSVELLPQIAAAGRLDWAWLEESGHLAWDGEEPWSLQFRFEPSDEPREEVLTGVFRRGDEQLGFDAVRYALPGGFLVTDTTLSTFAPAHLEAWVRDLRRQGAIPVPLEHKEELLEMIGGQVPGLAAEPTEELGRPTRPPVPHLVIRGEVGERRPSTVTLDCSVEFDYGTGALISPETPPLPLADVQTGEWFDRDVEAERARLAEYLDVIGGRNKWEREEGAHGSIKAHRLPMVVDAMLAADWTVEAEGRLLRQAGEFSFSVRSGLDWFDLEGGMEFGDQVVAFPELLASLKKKSKMVKLGDGTFGVLPEQWLASWGILEMAGGGAEGGEDALRFKKNQGWLIDALLAGKENVETDADFDAYRKRLAKFKGLRARKEPRGFTGELREYQREGLGWFKFLQDLGLGGCLADDMGLGKTIQVLAMLEGRRLDARNAEGGPRPSLVVVPRSLVFNWISEAEKFTPRLRTLDYTGPDRALRLSKADGVDLLVTTYGTLRRDAPKLAETRFDYVILDEATAIKNAQSQAAKASRLINADHRLALTGTPIENHIGELWSLFEFLNPGMLGRSKAFRTLATPGAEEDDSVQDLANSMRPFFLRRTKEAVLTELPPKMEQVIMCELAGKERQRYDELREHYRAELLGANATKEIGKVQFVVLEALLRLRQAACHPGLANKDLVGESSAKIDELLPRLEELAAEGHKVLVFSQFTSMLAIVRERLDSMGMVYEYLDGQTVKRADKVERFQTDEDCPVFLISLKAGGHGLNLTASDYVFLLDPWWNPAIEAQAIDRAHRMGQERPVFAYRLIAKDTVEERVLELQASKRKLADALFSEGKSPLQGLTRQDLELLFR